MPSGFEMSLPKANENNMKNSFYIIYEYQSVIWIHNYNSVRQLSFIITCAENMKENALLVFQNTAGYRTEYTSKAKA